MIFGHSLRLVLLLTQCIFETDAIFCLWIRTTLCTYLALLQRPLNIPRASSPTFHHQLIGSFSLRRYMPLWTTLELLPWVSACLKLCLMSIARPNEVPLILCSVKDCLSLSPLKRHLCLLSSCIPLLWWFLILNIPAVLSKAPLTRHELYLSIISRESKYWKLDRALISPEGGGGKKKWGNVWKMTWASFFFFKHQLEHLNGDQIYSCTVVFCDFKLSLS